MKEIYKIPKGQNVATSKGWKHIDTEIKDFVYETEQVPESFAELKQLCKDLEDVAIDDKDTMDVARICLFGFGITYFEDYILMIGGYKKTSVLPAQMWQIIKSLIGEE